MKTKLFLTMCILLYTNLFITKHKVQVNKPKTLHDILFIIKFHNKPPVITSNNFVDPSDREYIHFLHGEQYGELFTGLKTKTIAIVQIKAGAHPLTLADVFNKYHISNKYLNSKIFYNDEILDFPETLLISANQISTIKIKKTVNGSAVVDIKGTDFAEIKKLKDMKNKRKTFVD